jgi:hypothetical protein
MRKSTLLALLVLCAAPLATDARDKGGGHGPPASRPSALAPADRSTDRMDIRSHVDESRVRIDERRMSVRSEDLNDDPDDLANPRVKKVRPRAATHGALVSATAHQAKAEGVRVGPRVRAVARSKSQGPAHASKRAIARVNNSPGRAENNSVLSGNTTTSGSSTSTVVSSTRTSSTVGTRSTGTRSTTRTTLARNQLRADQRVKIKDKDKRKPTDLDKDLF